MAKEIQAFNIGNFNSYMSVLVKNIFHKSDINVYTEKVILINNVLENLRAIGISEQGFVFAAQIWFSDTEMDKDAEYFESYFFSFALNAVINSLKTLSPYFNIAYETQLLASLKGLNVYSDTIEDFRSLVEGLGFSDLSNFLQGFVPEVDECFFGF